MARPLEESYWVVEGRLLAGEYPGRQDPAATRERLDALLEAGFDTFIDLTQAGELVPYQPLLEAEARRLGRDIHWRRFPIANYDLPTPQQMSAILDALDQALEAGGRIYLHCWGGIGRTGTVVGCHLVRHGYSGEQALAQLAAWWRGVPKSLRAPHSPETHSQEEMVRSWHELA
jgi:hypothetical protein